MKHTLPWLTWMLIGLLLLSACNLSGAAMPLVPPSVDPDQPVASDDPPTPAPVPPQNLKVLGPLDLSDVTTDLLVLESYPLQYNLVLRGTLPTPCHQLLITLNKPNARGEIHVEALVAVDPEVVCAQVLADFEKVISLGSYETNVTHTVWVNQTQVAEFTP